MGPNDGKGQKANLPESLAGLGARVAVSTKGSGIEGSKVDARRSSRAGCHRHRRRAHASWTAGARTCVPVMPRQPHRTTGSTPRRPCKSLPKPSRNPHTRVLATSLQQDPVFARKLVICFAMRNPLPLPRLRLRSLVSPSPPLAVCLPSPSACGRRRPARIAGRACA